MADFLVMSVLQSVLFNAREIHLETQVKSCRETKAKKIKLKREKKK